jgi:hypothetical protein
MSKRKKAEEEATQDPEAQEAEETVEAGSDPRAESEGQAGSDGAKSSAGALKDAWKQVFGQALSVALQGRGNVVMVRVNDEALQHLDMLVEAEITKSRSESAAFLINEGIHGNNELFDRIRSITQQIVDLRSRLRREVQREVQNRQQDKA